MKEKLESRKNNKKIKWSIRKVKMPQTLNRTSKNGIKKIIGRLKNWEVQKKLQKFARLAAKLLKVTANLKKKQKVGEIIKQFEKGLRNDNRRRNKWTKLKKIRKPLKISKMFRTKNKKVQSWEKAVETWKKHFKKSEKNIKK